MTITLYGRDFETDWRQRGVCAEERQQDVAELGEEDGSGVLDMKTTRKGVASNFYTSNFQARTASSKFDMSVSSSASKFQVDASERTYVCRRPTHNGHHVRIGRR